MLARDWVIVFVDGVLDNVGALQCERCKDLCLSSLPGALVSVPRRLGPSLGRLDNPDVVLPAVAVLV